MVRLVKIEEIPAVTADYRRRHGLPEIDPNASPAERMRALQQALDNMTLRLERLSRMVRRLRDEE